MNAQLKPIDWRAQYGTTPPTMDADQAKAYAEWLLGFQSRPWDWVLTCYPWGIKGSPLQRRLPELWQRKFLMRLQTELQKPGVSVNEVANRVLRFAVAAGNGIGKGHSNELVIPTPDGPRRWGDLVVGDEVFASDGKPTRITGVHPRGVLPMYRVAFDDGTTVECDGDHLWRTRREATVNGVRRQRGEWENVDTRTLYAGPVRRDNGSANGTRIWDIPTQGAAEYPKRRVPIDPYLLGLWIANGHAGSMTNPLDPELDDVAAAHGIRTAPSSRGTACKTWYLRGWLPALRQLNLLESRSWSKFIPDDYLTACIEDRTALLAGLMDTDGTIGKDNGTATYDTTSERLAHDVVTLARSLGGKARIQSAVKQAFYRDANGEKVMCRPCYRVTVRMPFNPFRIARKASRWSMAQERYLSRWIESIEPCGEADVTCISVEHESQCYLTNDYVVTHNTGLVAWLVHWFMSCFPHGEAVITAGTRDQLDGKTWRELLKWQSLAVNGWQMEWTATRYKQRDAPGTWFAEARAWSESNPDAMAGTHEKYVLMLFDEASAIANIIWETVEGAMTTGYVFFFVFGNPTQLSGGFYNCFHGLGANRWIQDRVDAREVSFANKPEIESWITTWGADSDFVRVHVHGMFPRQENASFISTSVIDAAAQRVIQWREIPQAIPRLLGVDIARQGTDLNTIIRRQGRKMLKEIDRFHERNLMATADYIIRIINEWRPALVFVDGVGVGAGVVDNLWQRGFRDIVIDVQSGTTSKDPKEAIRFLNMRSVMWARMREWLTMADLPMDPQLMEELAAPRFKFTLNTDKLVIESKDDMRARGVKSPNVADALAHTFWQAIPVAPGSMGYAEPEIA